MSEIAWFALLLRAIGLFILVDKLPVTVGYLSSLAQLFSDYSDPFWAASIVLGLLGYLAADAVGVYLLFGGKRIVRFCVRDLVARCAVCGYPLAKVVGPVCPECGVPIQNDPSRASVQREEQA
jgi:hypothetical protein